MKKINKINLRKITKIALVVFLAFINVNCAAQDNENKLSSFQYMKKLNHVFDYVQQNYVDELDPKILYEGALKGMLDAIGDPYTLYLDSDAMRGLNDTTSGNFGGVGLSISKSTESTPEKPAYVEVASPIEGGPGQRAGVQAGDFIIAINGESTAEITLNDVLDRLRGDVGTPVTITILRGKTMRFDVKLVRELIEVPTVKYGMIEGTRTGYVRLIQFTPETAPRLQDALNSFQSNNYDSLIIDLRDNPGGLITSAVDVADKFIENGPIVTTKSRLLFENQEYKATKSKTVVKNIPIAVLINRGAASASEIVSGALKDYHLAYLVGERTYGKGSVQQVISLSNIDGMKITMARYYTPSDSNIDKIGIPPDLEIKNLENFTEEEEKIYVKMREENVISSLVEENPAMTEQNIAEEAKKLSLEYPLDLRLLRRLIRIQVQRYSNELYDLDYDLQLNEALKVVQSKDFGRLVKSTKTLKQLQEEVESNNLAKN